MRMKTKKRTYITNCGCPKCKNLLRTSDVEGYSFVCSECDENFYGIEVRDIGGDFIEITILHVGEGTFKKYLKELQKITDEAKADFLGYDEFSKCIDIGWVHMPTSEQIEIVTKALDSLGL